MALNLRPLPLSQSAVSSTTACRSGSTHSHQQARMTLHPRPSRHRSGQQFAQGPPDAQRFGLAPHRSLFSARGLYPLVVVTRGALSTHDRCIHDLGLHAGLPRSLASKQCVCLTSLKAGGSLCCQHTTGPSRSRVSEAAVAVLFRRTSRLPAAALALQHSSPAPAAGMEAGHDHIGGDGPGAAYRRLCKVLLGVPQLHSSEGP